MSSADYSPTSTRMHPISSTAQLRKIKKPLIERRRRERINECLNQLKVLVLEAMHKDESRYSKMEKADILEMTVAHLKSIQHRRPQSMAIRDPESVGKYVVGFNECALEVVTYLKNCNQLSSDVHIPLIRHLGECLQKAPQPMLSETSSTSSVSLPGTLSVSPSSDFTSTGSCFTSPATVSQTTRVFSPVSDASACSPNSTSRLSPPMMSPLLASSSPPAMLSGVIPLYACSQNIDVRSVGMTVSSGVQRNFTSSPTQADEVPHMLWQDSGTTANTLFSVAPSALAGHRMFCAERPEGLIVEVKSEVWRPW